MTTYQDLMMDLPCDYCGAQRGEVCRTRWTGRPTSILHTSRRVAAQQVLARWRPEGWAYIYAEDPEHGDGLYDSPDECLDVHYGGGGTVVFISRSEPEEEEEL